MRYALANRSLFAYIQQDAAVLSKGPFRVVGRRYKKKITYANAYATFFKLFSFCTQNAMIFRSKSKTRSLNKKKNIKNPSCMLWVFWPTRLLLTLILARLRAQLL